MSRNTRKSTKPKKAASIEEHAFDDPELPSKSERKRQMRALFDLGETLCNLPVKHRQRVPIADELLPIIERIHTMPAREARRRELRYLAKQLQQVDTEAIIAALDQIAHGNRDDARAHQQLEQLRDLALDDMTVGIEAIIAEFPDADRQLLGQLIRNAAKETKQAKAPASARKLFRYLRELQHAD